MLGIVFASIVAALAAVYLAGVFVFSGHFWPNSVIGAHDISFKTSAEVEQVLEDSVSEYTLRVRGLGIDVTLSTDETGVEFNASHVTEGMFQGMNAWAWPLEVLSPHDETESLVATVGEAGLSDKLRDAVAAVNEGAEPPENAKVAYDEASRMFAVVPEKYSTQIDVDAVFAAVGKAVTSLQSSVTLTDAELARPEVLSTDARLTQAAAEANSMILANLQLTMAGQVAATVDAPVIAPWISFGDDFSVSLDEEALEAWADEVAESHSTLKTERTYTRADGKSVTVPAGSYGWKVNSDELASVAKEAVESDQVGTVELPCSQTAGAWNGVGARDWGARYVDVDLSEQYARFYGSDGSVIWESPIVSGKPRSSGGSLTPAGVYAITTKASPSTLKGTNDDGSKYETKVEYWMPFVGNLIGLHDANWQSSFGGTRYKDGAGSHGCVNLPPGKAEELYGMIENGDVVVSHW